MVSYLKVGNDSYVHGLKATYKIWQEEDNYRLLWNSIGPPKLILFETLMHGAFIQQ